MGPNNAFLIVPLPAMLAVCCDRVGVGVSSSASLLIPGGVGAAGHPTELASQAINPSRAICPVCLFGLKREIPLSPWISIALLEDSSKWAQPPLLPNVFRMFEFLNET